MTRPAQLIGLIGGSLPLAKEAERERRLFGLQLFHPGLGGHLLRTPKPRGRFGRAEQMAAKAGMEKLKAK